MSSMVLNDMQGLGISDFLHNLQHDIKQGGMKTQLKL